VKVSFSTRFPTLREGIERDNCDNSKDNTCVVLFWKKGRPNSVEYFEHHALHLRLEAVGSHEAPNSGRVGTFAILSLSGAQYISWNLHQHVNPRLRTC
jgi:hypothetical protein